MFLSSVLVACSTDRKMEQTFYEDLVRALMGKEAYLLFVFDKLLHGTLKHMPAIAISEECQASIQLYK